MKVAALQLDLVWERPDANIERAGDAVAEAAAAGAQLVVLPEMFTTGFTMAAERLAEPPGGPGQRFMSEAARRHSLWLFGSLSERGATGPHNVAHLYAPDGSERLRYAKLHPFSHAGEQLHYRAGDSLALCRLEDELTLGAAICYDLRFPELFRALALRGANLFVVPANWPAARARHWSQLLIARAIENQAWVVGVNRVGSGGGLDYSGGSVIIAPDGSLQASAGDEPRLLLGELDAAQAFRLRRDFPVLQDLRRDIFPGLLPDRAE